MRRCAANYAYQVHVPKAGGKEDISGRQTATGTPEDAMAHAHFNFFRIPDSGTITSAAAHWDCKRTSCNVRPRAAADLERLQLVTVRMEGRALQVLDVACRIDGAQRYERFVTGRAI